MKENNWSGHDIMQNRHLPFLRLAKIQDALNNMEINIWLKGLKGKVNLFFKIKIIFRKIDNSFKKRCFAAFKK